MKNWLDVAKRRRLGAWNCAFYALVAVVGFITLNVAGCGGGGGGGNSPVLPTVTLQFRDINNNPVNGTGNLRGGAINLSFTTANGDATLPNVPAGTYNVTGTINGTAFSQTIAVGRDGNQTFFLLSGSNVQGIVVTGRIFLNRGDAQTGNCPNPTADQGVVARVLIRVRRLADNAIIASFERPAQPANTPDAQRGVFLVTLPNGTYRLEVRQASTGTSTDAPAPITGNSPAFQVPASTSVTICANEGTTAPNGTPRPTATFLPTVTPGGATPTPTTTDAPAPTSTPTPTTRPTPTVTPGGPQPGPSFTPAPTNTPNPNGTATPTGGPPPAPLMGRRK